MTEMTELGEAMERWRLERDLTKMDAARRAGFSRRTWHELLTDPHPDPRRVEQVRRFIAG